MSESSVVSLSPADPVEPPTAAEAADYPPNVLGASALILTITGLLLPIVATVTSLIGIGLGIGSLVRSRRSRHQRGGVGIAAIIIGLLGLVLTAIVVLRLMAQYSTGAPA